MLYSPVKGVARTIVPKIGEREGDTVGCDDVGLFVGVEVTGDKDGLLVGIIVGDGLLDGVEVGCDVVGPSVGVGVTGDNDGVFVGVFVGRIVGVFDGAADSISDGVLLGDIVTRDGNGEGCFDTDGCSVGNSVETNGLIVGNDVVG